MANEAGLGFFDGGVGGLAEARAVDVNLAQRIGIVAGEMKDVEVVSLIKFDLRFEAAAHSTEWIGADKGPFLLRLQACVEEQALWAEEVVHGEGSCFEGG